LGGGNGAGSAPVAGAYGSGGGGAGRDTGGPYSGGAGLAGVVIVRIPL
jgi:hypothetical protein